MGDNTYLDLPRIGEKDKYHKLANFGTQLRVESVTQRSAFVGTNGNNLDFNLSLYLYGRIDGSDYDTRPTLNKIQGTINTFSSMACRTPANISLRCTSIEEDAVWLLKKPYSIPPAIDPNTQQVMVDPMTGQPHQPIPLQLFAPIDPAVVDAVPENFRVELSSDAVVKWYQTIFDFNRRETRADQAFRDLILYKQIYGWFMGIIGWDSISKLPLLNLLPCLQWYPDTTVSDVKDMIFVGVDWPIDAELAKRKFPDATKTIDEYCSKAIDYAPGSAGYSSIYQLLASARPMVTLQFFWLRNQEAPMTLSEAMDNDLVDEVPNVPVTPDAQDGEEAQGPQIGEGESQGEAEAGGEDDGAGSGLADMTDQIAHGNPSMNIDDMRNSLDTPPPPVIAAAVVAPPTRPTKIIHKHTGDDLTSSFNEDGSPSDDMHLNHPQKLVIRQWIQIDNQVVEDVVCPYPDIPILLDKNTPITNRPFGQPETVRLASIQQSLNDVHTSTVNHIGWFKGPTGMMDKGNEEKLPRGMKDGFGTGVGNLWMIPGECFYDENGNYREPITFIEPPPMPAALPMMKTQLDEDYNDVAGHPDVEQGQAPPGVHSGVAIRSLQGASQASSGFKSMYSEEAIWRWAIMHRHAIVWWMSVDDLMQINRSLPAEIVAQYQQFAQKMRWDVDVDLATGGGQVKADKDNQIRADAASGLLDVRTAREKLDYDADEIERNEKDVAKDAAAQQAMRPTAPAPQGGPPQLALAK